MPIPLLQHHKSASEDRAADPHKPGAQHMIRLIPDPSTETKRPHGEDLDRPTPEVPTTVVVPAVALHATKYTTALHFTPFFRIAKVNRVSRRWRERSSW
jgi:hypothetical protein